MTGMPSSERERSTGLFRRTYLAAVGTGVLGGVAGCTEGLPANESETTGGDGNGEDDPWSREARLTPETDLPSSFGRSAAVAGETALIGTTAGEAFVY